MLRAYHERGDGRARQRLIELYLPLVESFTRRYARGSADYDDLYQVGCVGLINAIDRFDLDQGEELAAFAAPNITGEIRRYLRDNGSSVRLPRAIAELRTPARRAQGELGTELGRAPTAGELARHLGVDEADLSAALEPQTEELQAEAGDERPHEAAEDRMFVSEAVRELGERERRILYLRYVRDLGPDEIARALGISRRQLSRNSKDALTKLRVALEDHDGQHDNGKPEAMKAGDAGEAPDPARYLEQPYHVEVAKEEPPGKGWVAQVDELPGCTAQGPTREEATRGIDAAMREWIADALANGREVPKPRAPASHSGRLLVRMPTSLHADLARAAEREEVSLNQFITSSLASVVSWQRGDEPAAREAPSGETAPSAPRGSRRALMANLVVLVVLVILAIVLLAIALSRL